MKTILVPLDGSVLAEQVLPYVQLLAQTMSARIYLLHVLSEMDKELLLASDPTVLDELNHTLQTDRERDLHIWDVLRYHAGNYLLSHATTLRQAGFDVDVDVRIGPPAEMITDIADIERAALIMMATHGYSGLRRWTIGSVTDKVVQDTTVPVFITRCTERAPQTLPNLKRIMVPLDDSAFARQALPFALELATNAQAELLLLRAVVPAHMAYPGIGLLGPHMRSQADVLPEEHAQVAQSLQTTAGKLDAYEVPVTTRAVDGYPAEVIVDEARQNGVDLIVMATHGYTGLQRCALGSVADKVFHATTTPLVLVRVQGAEEAEPDL